MPHCYGKHKGLIIGRSERVAKGVGILQCWVHLEIFVGFKNQNVDFSREMHPLFSLRVAGGFAPKRIRTHFDSPSDQELEICLPFIEQKKATLWA